MDRIVTHRYWPPWVAIVCLIAGLFALAGLTGCREGVPAMDVAPGGDAANGTLSGTVTVPAGAMSLDGRTVDVVNIDTGERQRVTTNKTGRFTLKLRPGKYRLELALHEGEALVKEPGIVDLSQGEAHASFVVGSSRVSRPHRYRVEDGLGAPMA